MLNPKNLIVDTSEKGTLSIKPKRMAFQENWFDEMNKWVKQGGVGFADRDYVFNSNQVIQGKVFSIELLTDPLILKKEKNIINGKEEIKISVEINRKNVSYALYTTAAKKKLCEVCFNKWDHMQDYAKMVDIETHKFFLGISEYDTLVIDLNLMPMRWVSGGVFSSIEFNNRKWSHFFFRDIDPSGWNIPLGASEKNNEIMNPWINLWREFIEEFLVLDKTPDNFNKIEVRSPTFDNIREFITSTEIAHELINKHIEMRKTCDLLDVELSKNNFLNLQIDSLCNDSITISTHGNYQPHNFFNNYQTVNNLFVAINPFELGIETVAIIDCQLNSHDYILDGEILEPEGGVMELVRMPVALISHDFLSKFLNKNMVNFEYHKDKNGNISQSSIKLKGIPEHEVKAFNWDIRQRNEILDDKSTKTGVGKEKERYEKWKKNFADIMYNDYTKEYLGLFTPTSAKIACYYFTKKEQKELMELENKLLTNSNFDVYLCYNSINLIQVEKIALKLKDANISFFLDKWNMRAGNSWRKVLEQSIVASKIAIIFLGQEGIGPWMNLEIDILIQRFVKGQCKIIPVILNDYKEKIDTSIFLDTIQHIDLRDGASSVELLINEISSLKENL